jgi:hypothetical protein
MFPKMKEVHTAHVKRIKKGREGGFVGFSPRSAHTNMRNTGTQRFSRPH